MANKQRGLESWAKISDIQLEIIKTEGAINKDDRRIWDILHSWDNSRWLEVLDVLADLQEAAPELFSKTHNQAFAAAAKILVEQGAGHHKVLNKREHKATYWRFVMCLREVWFNTERQASKPNLFEHA